MDKIAAYKEAIYKEAMALSKREAFRAIYGIARDAISGAEKVHPTSTNLNFSKKLMEDALPSQRINFFKKLPSAEIEKSRQRTLINGKHSRITRFVEAPVSQPAVVAHEFAHAGEYDQALAKRLRDIQKKYDSSEANKTRNKWLMKEFESKVKPEIDSRNDLKKITPNSYSLSRTVANTHDSMFQRYINEAFMDGNRNSQRMGLALSGVWKRAMANGDQKLLSEYFANAKSYLSMVKHYGKEAADGELGTQLSSMLSYTNGRNAGSAFDELKNVVQSYGVKNKRTGQVRSLLNESVSDRKYSTGGFSEFKDKSRIFGWEK